MVLVAGIALIMRKFKSKPDTRPRWNDPNLPIYFSGKWYSADEWQKLCAHTMSLPSRAEPHYTKDPTYNLRKNFKPQEK